MRRSIEACLGEWRETKGGTATLINLSENHTFRIDTPRGGRFILRVHRPGYQSAAAIESELDWLAALRAATDLPLPRPLPGRDGRLLQRLEPLGEAPRHAVLFAMEPGAEPAPAGELGGLFETVGRFAATAHLQAMAYAPGPNFIRPRWDAPTLLDPDGPWGDWRRAPQAGEVAPVLGRLEARLREELARYGQGRERFGLIHADMRLGNLLVAGARVTLIDFDDCGFGWFMYDLAAALSFHEADPRAPEWRRRWLIGYQALRPLSPDDLGILDAMVLLRRMALLAWIGSHHETSLARAHAADFAAVTARLAGPWLAR